MSDRGGDIMKRKNIKKLVTTLLLGSTIIPTYSEAAASYGTSLTGVKDTDNDTGYLADDSILGELTYTFNNGDQIFIDEDAAGSSVVKGVSLNLQSSNIILGRPGESVDIIVNARPSSNPRESTVEAHGIYTTGSGKSVKLRDGNKMVVTVSGANLPTDSTVDSSNSIAYGISNDYLSSVEIGNNNQFIVSATGGNGYSTGEHTNRTTSTGILGSATLGDGNEVVVSAVGGLASATEAAYNDAFARGLDGSFQLGNNNLIQVESIGGQSISTNSTSRTQAFANGITTNYDDEFSMGDGNRIEVTAMGGISLSGAGDLIQNEAAAFGIVDATREGGKIGNDNRIIANSSTHENAVVSSNLMNNAVSYGIVKEFGEALFVGDRNYIYSFASAENSSIPNVAQMDASSYGIWTTRPNTAIQMGNENQIAAISQSSQTATARAVMNQDSGSISLGNKNRISAASISKETALGYGLYNQMPGGHIALGDENLISVETKGRYVNSFGIKNEGGAVQIGNNTQIYNNSFSDSRDGYAYSLGWGASNIDGTFTTGENTKIRSTGRAAENAENTIIYSIGVENQGNGSVILGNQLQIDAVAENGIPYAWGIKNSSTGDVEVLGDVRITASATTDLERVTPEAYSLYGDNSGKILINQSGGKKVELVGDIGAVNSSGVYVTLDNSSSYLEGLSKSYNGEIFLSLSDGGRWLVTGDGDNDNKVYSSFGPGGKFSWGTDGVVELSWWNNRLDWNPGNKYRTLEVDKATFLSGGILRVNSDVSNEIADKMVVDSAEGSGIHYVQIGYDPIVKGMVAGETKTLTSEPGIPVLILTNNGTTDFDVTGLVSTVDSPLTRYKLDPYVVYDPATGIAKISSIKSTGVAPSETPQTSSDAQLSYRNLWYLENDHMMRRLGDLRLKNQQAESGLWVRAYTGSLKNDSAYGRYFEQDYSGVQLGFDREFKKSSGNYYVGLMVNHLISDSSYKRGEGEAKSTGVGIYGSWVSPKGHYVDLVFRASRLSNDFHLLDKSNEYVSGDYHSWGYGASAEYGYRKDLSHQFFIEPQVQIGFGHLGKANYTTSNGVRMNQSSIDTTWGRLGILFGKYYQNEDGSQKGNVYIRGSVIHDFGSSGSLTAQYKDARQSLETVDYDTSFEVNLGTNLHVNQTTDVYIELTKSFGGNVRTNWQINGGIRFNW